MVNVYKLDLVGVMNLNSFKLVFFLIKFLVIFVVFNKSLLFGVLGNIGKLYKMFKFDVYVFENRCKFKCFFFVSVVVGEL